MNLFPEIKATPFTEEGMEQRALDLLTPNAFPFEPTRFIEGARLVQGNCLHPGSWLRAQFPTLLAKAVNVLTGWYAATLESFLWVSENSPMWDQFLCVFYMNGRVNLTHEWEDEDECECDESDDAVLVCEDLLKFEQNFKQVQAWVNAFEKYLGHYLEMGNEIKTPKLSPEGNPLRNYNQYVFYMDMSDNTQVPQWNVSCVPISEMKYEDPRQLPQFWGNGKMPLLITASRKEVGQ